MGVASSRYELLFSLIGFQFVPVAGSVKEPGKRKTFYNPLLPAGWRGATRVDEIMLMARCSTTTGLGPLTTNRIKVFN